MATAFPDRSHGSSRTHQSTSPACTPKPCRLRRHPDHHSRTLLAQFGLTPKSRRGVAAREVVDPLNGVGGGLLRLLFLYGGFAFHSEP